MASNTRVATAVQILCVIRFRDNATTSDDIARSLGTNPVVVRRLLKDMARAGFVALKPGKDGGVMLTMPAERITIDRVFHAVEGDGGIFALRPGGNPRCPVNQGMKRLLPQLFAEVGTAVDATLGRTTIADLMRDI
jgi:Rrf2 family protein